MAALAQPPLTAIDLPAARMSRMAVDLLVDMLAGKPPAQPAHVLSQTDLIVRGSTCQVGPAGPPMQDTPGQGGPLGQLDALFHTVEMTRCPAPSTDEGLPSHDAVVISRKEVIG